MSDRITFLNNNAGSKFSVKQRGENPISRALINIDPDWVWLYTCSAEDHAADLAVAATF